MARNLSPVTPSCARRTLRVLLWCSQILLFALVMTCSKSTGPEPSNRPPNVPSLATTSPPQGSSEQPIHPTLRWLCTDPDNDSLRYDVYFGTDSIPPLVDSQLTQPEYQPGTLHFDTRYFWRVVANDGFGHRTSSPAWNFKTVLATTLSVTPAHIDFGARIDSVPAVLTYSGSDTISWRAHPSESWLNVKPDSGIIAARPETVLVVADRNQLSIGSYTGAIQFTSIVAPVSVEVSIVGGALTWQQVIATIGKPAARQSHSAFIDSIRGRLLIFGGWDYAGERNDLWEFDLASQQWDMPLTSGTPPSPRAAHTVCYDPIGRAMLIFGGVRANFTPTILGDVVRLDLNSGHWDTPIIPGPMPAARFNHTAIYDPIAGDMVVYGGLANDTTFGDLWRFSLAKSTWSKVTPIGSVPEPRDGHSAMFDPASQSMVIFGGWHGGGPSNDVWKLDLMTNVWSQLTTSGLPPAPRTRHSAVYSPTNGSMLIFGGQGAQNQDFNDLWALNLKTGKWSAVPVDGISPSPAARSSQTLSYDPRTHSFFMYAGWGAGTNARSYLDDLWRLRR